MGATDEVDEWAHLMVSSRRAIVVSAVLLKGETYPRALRPMRTHI
jgi:hypothetical protein